ncbi:MAG TPA: response regulator transcription factor [Burkholderiales bacterium]|jgi:DNA-binding NarL/FixJ family response regulator|nr:response regulator transcription factor [Burkholderiales bacterium]
MIRVLIADDHQLVRDGLRQLLNAASGLEVVAEAADGDRALAAVRESAPHVALLDMSMPGPSGIDLIKRIKASSPQVRVLVLSMHGERQYAARALKAGASGYLTKDSAGEQLVSAIRKVAAGGVYLTDAAAASLVQGAQTSGAPHEALTDREFDILRRLAAGDGPTEIAEQLHLSVKTVSTHKTRILEKMGLDNTADLVRYALQHHLTEAPPARDG